MRHTKQPICPAHSVNSGRPCRKQTLPGDQYCYDHSKDPGIIAARHSKAKKAGSSKEYLPMNKNLSITDSRGLYKYLGTVLTSMAKGKVRLTTTGLKDIAALGKLFIEAENKANLQNRLEKLESK